jgi:succinate dehydrogenase/fumarate reductase flavoprotein subunit
VLVIGGGMAGISAAIAASRMGMKTQLIEYFGYPGGNATNALVNDFCGFYTRTKNTVQLIKGVGGEIVQSLLDAGKANRWRHVVDFDPETLKTVLDKKLMEAGVQTLYYTMFAAPIMAGNKIQGAIIENKSGRQAVLAKVVVDTTGDGDVCAATGVPYELGDGQGSTQPCEMGFKIVNVNEKKFDQAYFFENAERLMAEGIANGEYKLTRTGGYLGNALIPGVYSAQMARVPWSVNGTDAEHLTKASIEGRQIAREFARFLQKKIPGMETAEIIETGNRIGLRETRRVMGEYLLTENDILNGVKFADGIAANAWPIEMHITGQLKRKMLYLNGDDYHTIPYRCLLPRKVDGLLMAGRFISCTHNAQASIRVMGPATGMGHAAGIAAAFSVRDGVEVRAININRLRKELINQEAFLG